MKNLPSDRNVWNFTLIELLVVVAIIGILLSILIPSLAKSRELTRRSVCKSNHHQFYISISMFAEDNDGKFDLPARKNGPVQFIKNNDKVLLEPYIDWSVTDCPNIPGNMSTIAKKNTETTFILLLAGMGPADDLTNFTDWESAQTLTAENDLVILADWNENSGGTWNSRTTHGKSGLILNYSGGTPKDIGSEGTVITKLNGSSEWRSINKMKPYAANTSHPNVEYWW